MNYETPLDADSGDRGCVAERLSDARVVLSRIPRRRIVLSVGAVLAVILLLGLLFGREGGGTMEDAAAGQLPAVSVIAPGTTTIVGTIDATGTLAARREMPVGSVGEGGQIVSVPVEAGDWVRKGQVLAVIDRSVQSQQVAGQRAQLASARADASLAQANLDRALKLVDRGFISKADVDRLTANRDGAIARVDLAKAQLAEMQARTARLNIVAPAAGLVLARNVEPGQVVSGGSGMLFSIARGGEFELLARLSEEELARITPGVTAKVTPVASEKSFTGQVWQVSPVIDPNTRQGTARIALSYAPQLRPGGFASVEIRSGTIVAPLLPESAIQSDEKGSFVLVVGKDGAVARRAVKTGLITERGIAISEGLTGKERVVMRAGAFLSPGDKVSPRLVKRGGD